MQVMGTVNTAGFQRVALIAELPQARPGEPAAPAPKSEAAPAGQQCPAGSRHPSRGRQRQRSAIMGKASILSALLHLGVIVALVIGLPVLPDPLVIFRSEIGPTPRRG